jgi:hypothetical protein
MALSSQLVIPGNMLHGSYAYQQQSRVGWSPATSPHHTVECSAPDCAAAAVVIGWALQGRGLSTQAYTHSLETSHHMFMKLDNGKVRRLQGLCAAAMTAGNAYGHDCMCMGGECNCCAGRLFRCTLHCCTVCSCCCWHFGL